MKSNRIELFHKLLLWLAIITFSVAWGFSAALADDDDDDPTLSALAISGPSSVNESSSATFTATATFSDGSKRTVTSSASWSDSSEYASISSGVLRTNSVSSNRSLTITARYSRDGISRSASKSVTILNGGGTTVTLSSLTIVGANSVNEGATSAYTATAAFSNGTTQNVTNSVAWSENSSYASISSGGVLTASQVSSNQSVTVTASYTSNGVTRSDTHAVTVVNVATPPPAATLRSIAIGGPDSVNENTTTSFPVTATMSDNTTKTVAATMTEAVSFASFSGTQLTTTEVTANQTMQMQASYTEGNVTQTTTKNITVANVTTTPPPPPPPVTTGSHAGRFTTYSGTSTCLACHRDQAVQMHNSEHYQWAGKLGAINDFCIYPDINHVGLLTNYYKATVGSGCSKCHVGRGAKPVATTAPTDAQLENIDCLVCHSPKYKRKVDATGTAWVADVDAMAAAGTASLDEAAMDIQKTTRDTCLNCHTKSGGGDNFKRGDIEEHHRNPATRAFDVHMSSTALGGGGLQCTACHTVASVSVNGRQITSHKISGRGMDLRKEEGTKVDCINCHTAAPHTATTTLTSTNATALNTHAKRIHCATCHVPQVAKVAPTDMRRDWSVAGELNTTTGLYDPVRNMVANLAPSYVWWNGQSQFYNFGTNVVPGSDGKVLMAGPTAVAAASTGAKIYPVKVHDGYQPIEVSSSTKRLLPLKIGQFYMQGTLTNAVPMGQASDTGVGWPNNPYGYQQTKRIMGLFHEVSPKENAIGYQNCNACHNTTTPKVPLKALGYTAKTGMTVTQVCSQCHSAETYSFSTAHTRSDHTREDCSRCHNFSKAQ